MTGDFRKTVRRRLKADPEFRQAIEREIVALETEGNHAAARILQAYIAESG